jgi:2-C-methyl-D-erythritol 4-phosphate cytidylyltransferase/2-C-methyl-D-erythritol 2,4-cyclodiphosphate synthase
MARVGVILVAAGSSTRTGGGTPKQFVSLGSEPMFVAAMRAVADVASEIVVVAPPGAVALAEGLLGGSGRGSGDASLRTRVSVVPGGDRRQDSVLKGLAALSPEVEIVLVHDAARPFATPALTASVVEAAERHGAAVPVSAVPDTVKRVEEGVVVATLDRSVLALAQTPQGFRRDVIERAYEALSGTLATDDAQAAELAGYEVVVVPGDVGNTKITEPLDLEIALLRAGRVPWPGGSARVGTGSDFHRLAVGRRLVLCGVAIPFDKGLMGWSDADVATHALMDALLGAVADGDIGAHFPPGDPRYEGISSMELLDRVVERVRAKGYEVANVDVTIVAEKPRLSPHVARMRESLASVLGVDEGCVSVKATTTEGIGPEGAGLAISAHAVAAVRASSEDCGTAGAGG